MKSNKWSEKNKMANTKSFLSYIIKKSIKRELNVSSFTVYEELVFSKRENSYVNYR